MIKEIEEITSLKNDDGKGKPYTKALSTRIPRTRRRWTGVFQ